MTILELREKRNTAWNAAKAFLDSHRTEKGTLTAEDDATYSRMEQEIADLGKEIARLERQEALESELNKPVNKPLTSKPGNSATDKPTKTGRASYHHHGISGPAGISILKSERQDGLTIPLPARQSANQPQSFSWLHERR